MGIEPHRAPPFSAREVAAMSRETSAGVATVTQLCEALGISKAAYYAAKKPRPAARVTSIRRAPRHTSSDVALDAIREVIRAEPAWGVRDRADPQHVWRIVREPVDFPSAIRALCSAGAFRFLDLSPDASMRLMLAKNHGNRTRIIGALDPFREGRLTI